MEYPFDESFPAEWGCDYCGTEVPDGAGFYLNDDRICERCCEEAQPTFRSAWEGLDLSRVGGWIVRHYRATDSIVYGPFSSEREAFEFCIRWAPRGLTGMISPLISGEVGAEDLWDFPPWQDHIGEDPDADLQRRRKDSLMTGRNLSLGCNESDLPGWHDIDLVVETVCPKCGEIDLEITVDERGGEWEADCPRCETPLTGEYEPVGGDW